MAGVLGSVLLLGTFVFVAAAGLPDPSEPESLLEFSELRTARLVENTLYLAALVLMGAHVLALHRTLRRTSLTTSLFGSAAHLLGLALLISGAFLHVATDLLSDLHRSSPPEDQAAVVLVWRGVQSVFDTLLVTGAVLVALGLIGLGLAMRRCPGYGAVIGWVGLALGVIALLGSAVAVADPGSPAVATAILALLAFHAVVGGTSLRQARPAVP